MNNPCKLRYCILGTGVWGSRVKNILLKMDREVNTIEINRGAINSDYVKKLTARLENYSSKCDVLWIAIPPIMQYDISLIATKLGYHQIFEKPWLVSRNKTNSLISLMKEYKLTASVHYQYCYMGKLPGFAEKISDSQAKLKMRGEFTTSRGDRLGVSHLDNLGSHLVSIWLYYFPHIDNLYLETNYNSQNKRNIQIYDKENNLVDSLDFLFNNEHLVQKYILDFEASIVDNKQFKLDMVFASNVKDKIDKLRNV